MSCPDEKAKNSIDANAATSLSGTAGVPAGPLLALSAKQRRRITLSALSLVDRGSGTARVDSPLNDVIQMVRTSPGLFCPRVVGLADAVDKARSTYPRTQKPLYDEVDAMLDLAHDIVETLQVPHCPRCGRHVQNPAEHRCSLNGDFQKLLDAEVNNERMLARETVGGLLVDLANGDPTDHAAMGSFRALAREIVRKFSSCVPDLAARAGVIAEINIWDSKEGGRLRYFRRFAATVLDQAGVPKCPACGQFFRQNHLCPADPQAVLQTPNGWRRGELQYQAQKRTLGQWLAWNQKRLWPIDRAHKLFSDQNFDKTDEDEALDWKRERLPQMGWLAVNQGAYADCLSPARLATEAELLRFLHDAVEAALQDGKTLSEEILADHPDLLLDYRGGLAG